MTSSPFSVSDMEQRINGIIEPLLFRRLHILGYEPHGTGKTTRFI